MPLCSAYAEARKRLAAAQGELARHEKLPPQHQGGVPLAEQGALLDQPAATPGLAAAADKPGTAVPAASVAGAADAPAPVAVVAKHAEPVAAPHPNTLQHRGVAPTPLPAIAAAAASSSDAGGTDASSSLASMAWGDALTAWVPQSLRQAALVHQAAAGPAEPPAARVDHAGPAGAAPEAPADSAPAAEASAVSAATQPGFADQPEVQQQAGSGAAGDADDSASASSSSSSSGSFGLQWGDELSKWAGSMRLQAQDTARLAAPPQTPTPASAPGPAHTAAAAGPGAAAAAAGAGAGAGAAAPASAGQMEAPAEAAQLRGDSAIGAPHASCTPPLPTATDAKRHQQQQQQPGPPSSSTDLLGSDLSTCAEGAAANPAAPPAGRSVKVWLEAADEPEGGWEGGGLSSSSEGEESSAAEELAHIPAQVPAAATPLDQDAAAGAAAAAADIIVPGSRPGSMRCTLCEVSGA